MPDSRTPAELVTDNWRGRTLTDLRKEATRQPSGIAFTAIRAPNGPCFVLAMCIVDPDQLRDAFDRLPCLTLRDVDWGGKTLFAAWNNIANSSGILAEGLFDAADRPVALFLIAADPSSITILSKSFGVQL